MLKIALTMALIGLCFIAAAGVNSAVYRMEQTQEERR
jgi:hypothetical protein